MQQPPAVHQPYNPFAGTSNRPGSFITHKRVSLTVAGAFLLTAVILLLADNHAAGSSTNLQTSNSKLNTQVTAATPKGASTPPTNSGSTPAGDSSGTDPPPSSHTQVTVNGEDIPVPSQGSTSRTISSNNGTTTINVNQSSSQASSDSSSSSNLNLNVNSNSSSTSSTTN